MIGDFLQGDERGGGRTEGTGWRERERRRTGPFIKPPRVLGFGPGAFQPKRCVVFFWRTPLFFSVAASTYGRLSGLRRRRRPWQQVRGAG
jgi:hypothetical protein